jgi:hypothetical protein
MSTEVEDLQRENDKLKDQLIRLVLAVKPLNAPDTDDCGDPHCEDCAFYRPLRAMLKEIGL